MSISVIPEFVFSGDGRGRFNRIASSGTSGFLIACHKRYRNDVRLALRFTLPSPPGSCLSRWYNAGDDTVTEMLEVVGSLWRSISIQQQCQNSGLEITLRLPGVDAHQSGLSSKFAESLSVMATKSARSSLAVFSSSCNSASGSGWPSRKSMIRLLAVIILRIP